MLKTLFWEIVFYATLNQANPLSPLWSQRSLVMTWKVSKKGLCMDLNYIYSSFMQRVLSSTWIELINHPLSSRQMSHHPSCSWPWPPFPLMIVTLSPLLDLCLVECHISLLPGVYCPITASGCIIADGILASCYASFPHNLAHTLMLPARLMPSLLIREKGKVLMKSWYSYL